MNWEPITATLTASELMIATRQITGNGGHQGLLREIVRTIRRADNTFTITVPQLAQARVYANYNKGRGGYQDRFEAIVAAADRARPPAAATA